MRRLISLSASIVIGLAVLLSPPSAEARVVRASCATVVTSNTWQPLPVDQVERLVQGKVVAALTKSGKIALLKEGAGTLDLKVKVDARIIEDAEQFSVFVTATPSQTKRAGSFAAVASRSIHKMRTARIQAQMEAAAQEAASKLVLVLDPHLDLMIGEGGPSTKLDGPKGPRTTLSPNLAMWMKPMAGTRPSPLLRQLRGAKSALVTALSTLGPRAFRDASARMAIAQCAVDTRLRGKRLLCVDALARLVKKHSVAQRAILAVLAEDPPAGGRSYSEWSKARRRAFEISTTFEGVALQEAVQVWLHVLGNDHSDTREFNHSREDYLLLHHIGSYLQRKGDVPNLDLALARCTRPAKYKGGPPHAECLKLVKRLPVERRLRLLYPLLAKRARYSWYQREKWSGLLETVIDRNEPLHPLAEKLCMYRVERSFRWRERLDCIQHLGRGGKPSKALIDFLVLAFVSSGGSETLLPMYSREALLKVVQRERSLCDHLERTLGPYVARGAIPLRWAHDRTPRALRYCRGEDGASKRARSRKRRRRWSR